MAEQAPGRYDMRDDRPIGVEADRLERERIAKIAEEASERPSTARASELQGQRGKDMRAFTLQLLNAVATGGRTGEAIHPEDKAALIASALEDAKDAQPRVRAELAKVAERIVDRVAAGDRIGAEQMAREQAFTIGNELAKSPTFSPPSNEADVADALAQIPRA
jgi:hypothetical protein